MQDFAEATDVNGEQFVYGKRDGVLGLGFPKHAVNLVVPPFYNMINQGLLSEPVIAFYFGNASQDGDESEITFGGINNNHYSGDLIKLSLRRGIPWETEFNSITFGDWTTELNCATASIDTGSSMIVLPSALAELMYDRSKFLFCLNPDLHALAMKRWVLQETPTVIISSNARHVHTSRM
jgi:saccharopepsin